MVLPNLEIYNECTILRNSVGMNEVVKEGEPPDEADRPKKANNGNRMSIGRSILKKHRVIG